MSTPRLDENRLRVLIEASRAVVAERELEAVFDRLLQAARHVTGARYAALGVLDEDRKRLADFITVGIDEGRRHEIGDLPRGRGVLGLLISAPAPLRLTDVGSHPRSYGFPQGHPPMHSFLGVPILLRNEVWGILYLTEKEGGPFDEADEESAVVLAAWAAIAIENARLHRRGEERRSELGRSVEALQATTEIARAVGGETQLDRVLELIAKRSRALVEARGLAILLLDGEELVIAAAAGEIPLEAVGSRVAVGGSVAGRVTTTGRSERITDLGNSLRFALGDLGVEAVAGLFVPLRFRGGTLGVLEAFDRFEGPEFSAQDEALLQGAAASAATAVATAQSVERDRLRRSLQAAEEERRRWARELHDDTLQALGGLRVLLSSARRTEDPNVFRQAIDTAVRQIGEEIAGLRALITELRPASLDELGLGSALDALVERMRLVHGLQIETTFDLDRESGRTTQRLDPELETAVYRIIQESLTNAARHARADRVDVSVIQRGGEVNVTIADDGQGFDEDVPSEGFGLTGMRERVALANGRLELSSSPEGTVVTVSVPVIAAVSQTARGPEGLRA
jgi:signal transduction histidine kinase